MNADKSMNQPNVRKESKKKIKVDFERTSKWTRFRVKYLNGGYLADVIFRFCRFARDPMMARSSAGKREPERSRLRSLPNASI